MTLSYSLNFFELDNKELLDVCGGLDVMLLGTGIAAVFGAAILVAFPPVSVPLAAVAVIGGVMSFGGGLCIGTAIEPYVFSW